MAATSIEPPTATASGAAVYEFTTGQLSIVPLITTVPAPPAPRQSSRTLTDVLMLATTAKGSDVPKQVVPSLAVASRVTVYPRPAGMPPTTTETVPPGAVDGMLPAETCAIAAFRIT